MATDTPDLILDDIVRQLNQIQWASSYEIFFQSMDQISGHLVDKEPDINQIHKQGVAIRLISNQQRLMEFSFSITRLSILKDLAEPKSTMGRTVISEFPELRKPRIGAIPGDSGASTNVNKDLVQKLLDDLKFETEMKIEGIDFLSHVKLQRERTVIINNASIPLKSTSLHFVYDFGIESPEYQVGINRSIGSRNLDFNSSELFDEAFGSLVKQTFPLQSIDHLSPHVILHPEVIGRILAFHSTRFLSRTVEDTNSTKWNENLVLYDDPLQFGGFNSSLFDDEGLLTKTKTLVENGVHIRGLSTHFSTTSEPGGNAYRSSWFQPILRSYKFPLNQNISNLILHGGTGKGNQFTERSSECLVILRGHGYIGGTARNPRFTIHANECQLWKNGEFIGPTRNLTIDGSIDEILKYGNLSGDHHQVIDPAVDGTVYIGWLSTPPGLIRIY